MENYHLAGDFEYLANRIAQGWCWIPAEPGARLDIEILADDTVVARARADGYRRDLARNDIGDGRYAFRITLAPDAVPAEAMFLSARAVRGRRIFGRARLAPPRAADPRLETLAASLDALRLALAPPAPPAAGRDALRAGLARVGARLACPGDGPAGAIARRHARANQAAPTNAASGWTGPPAATILLWATCFDTAARTAGRLCSDVRRGRLQLLIRAPTTDPRTRLLASLCPDAEILAPALENSIADAAWAAATRDATRTLVVLDATTNENPADLLADILDRITATACLVGERVVRAAAAIGARDAFAAIESGGPDANALLLAVDRAAFVHAGGLDPALAATPAVAMVDFALRAALFGVRAIALRVPNEIGTHPRADGDDAAAIAAFGATWGGHFGIAAP